MGQNSRQKSVRRGQGTTQIGITCDLCKHYTMLEVANLIAVVGGDTTAHEVRQRARCHNCGVKGNNTYQIVYTGNSGIAMDGAGVKSQNRGN